LTTAEVFWLMEPLVAVNTALELLAITVTLVGTVSRLDEELNETVVFPEAGCESVTVQEAVALDIRLVGLQTNEDTWTAAVRLTVVLAELLLYVAVIVAL